MGKKISVALTGIDKSQAPLVLIDEQFIDLSGDPQAYPRLRVGLRHAGVDPLSFPLEPGRRPYPGFAYFEEQDAAVFFGREAQIVHGLDEFRGLVRTGVSRMLVILGASGSSKSSFLGAGLWPCLKRDDRAWLARHHHYHRRQPHCDDAVRHPGPEQGLERIEVDKIDEDADESLRPRSCCPLRDC
jgi:hypothetical protein